MTDNIKKEFFAVTVFVAIAGVSLVVTAVASDHWVSSALEAEANNETSNLINQNRTRGAKLSFGLFNGEADVTFGLGTRDKKFELKCDLSESICGYIEKTSSTTQQGAGYTFDMLVKRYTNGTADMTSYGLFGFSLFATNLVMLSLSLIFGLQAIGFAIFNIFGRPIETITGPAGLYLWNGLALTFVLIGIGVYMGLFYSQLTDTIPNMNMFINEDTVWEDDTSFDWSFFCVVGAAGAYFVNVLLLLISGKKLGSCDYNNAAQKEVQNDIILY